MTNKLPKAAYQILFGFLMLSFTVIACNNKKGEKKEVKEDTVVVQPQKVDTMEKVDTKPVKDPPPPPPAPTP